MRIFSFYYVVFAVIFCACQRAPLDDLNFIKKEFISSIVQEDFAEGPFHMSYSLRTVFFSKDLVSMFGELFVYDHLPHGYTRYEGKTYYRNNGTWKEVALKELFVTKAQKEFLRSYCEQQLQKNTLTHLFGPDPLIKRLKREYIQTFVIDDHFLIIVFQPYEVGGFADGPFCVKIPYEDLESHWAPGNPIDSCMHDILANKAWVSSWDENHFTSSYEKSIKNETPIKNETGLLLHQ